MRDRCLTFTVPGVPVAKGRPRVTRAGKFVRTYTPSETVDFENRVRFAAQQAGAVPLTGPVAVEILARFPMKGQPRKRVPRPEAWKPTKPDLDNVAKAVLDGLEGICFASDAQVVDLRAQKVHAAQGEAAETVVTVQPAREDENGSPA